MALDGAEERARPLHRGPWHSRFAYALHQPARLCFYSSLLVTPVPLISMTIERQKCLSINSKRIERTQMSRVRIIFNHCYQDVFLPTLSKVLERDFISKEKNRLKKVVPERYQDSSIRTTRTIASRSNHRKRRKNV